MLFSFFKKQMCGLFILIPIIPTFALDGHFYFGGEYTKSYAQVSNDAPAITYYQGFLTDSYSLANDKTSADILGIHGGYEFSGLGLRPAIALGVGLYTTPGYYQYNGVVTETALGDSSNALYSYQYHLYSSRLMAETKLTWNIAQHVAPFAEIGFGSAWLRMSHYSESPINAGGYTPLPGFQSHNLNNFAYQLGGGVGYSFNFGSAAKDAFQHDRLLLGYRFVNLGNVNFGTRGAAYPYALSFGKAKTNDIYLGLAHLF